MSEATRIWQDNLDGEAGHWENIIAGNFVNDTQRQVWRDRLDPGCPIAPYLIEPVAERLRPTLRILDVGSGPATDVGKVYNGHRLHITAVDPLADDYNAMLDRHNAHPPVRAVTGYAERLTELFAPNSFDFVHANNSLDHGYDPVAAIHQMLTVCKPGGWCFIQFITEEGEFSGYTGLHQWNFNVFDGQLFVWGRSGPRVNINKGFAGLIADFREQTIPSTPQWDWKRVWLQKHPDAHANLGA